MKDRVWVVTINGFFDSVYEDADEAHEKVSDIKRDIDDGFFTPAPADLSKDHAVVAVVQGMLEY